MIEGIKKYLLRRIRWFAGRRSYKWVVRDLISIRDIDTCVKVLTTDRFKINLNTLVREAPGQGKRILVIAPHQDDETIGAGGTLIQSAAAGAKITCVYITDGSLASSKIPEREMLLCREKEAREVWKMIGGDPIFLRYPDGGTPIDMTNAAFFADLIKQKNPDIIFIPFLLDNHPEHRRANHLFWNAKPHLTSMKCEIWAYQVWSDLIPNIAIDISNVMESKNRLNRLWKSQNVVRDYVHYSQGLNAYNSKFINTNLPAYIEVFFSVPINEYFELCGIYFNSSLIKLYSDYDNWLIRSKMQKRKAD